MANRARHAFGSSASLQQAIQAGKVDYFDILFLDGDTQPKIGWIDKTGNPVIVEPENGVVVETTLPETGEPGKIYIVGEDAFVWTGEKFANLCKPTDVSELEAELATKADAEEVENKLSSKADIAKVDEKLDKVATESIASAKAYTDEKVEAAVAEHLVKSYEIADVPIGTLVDYRDNEIRIMCPHDAIFTKQAVGENGDPNCYYATLKTYVPNDAVVGYIEHLGDQVDPEILSTFSTDEYGRKYQSTWLAIARYDETASVWSYYGVTSTKEHYIGWDYQIDWYDVNGVMIASDNVRINLSNEACHYEIKPYYIGAISKEVEEIIAEKIAEVEVTYEVIEF